MELGLKERGREERKAGCMVKYRRRMATGGGDSGVWLAWRMVMTHDKEVQAAQIASYTPRDVIFEIFSPKLIKSGLHNFRISTAHHRQRQPPQSNSSRPVRTDLRPAHVRLPPRTTILSLASPSAILIPASFQLPPLQTPAVQPRPSRPPVPPDNVAPS